MVSRSFPVSHHSCRGQTGFTSWWASLYLGEEHYSILLASLSDTSAQVWDLKLWGRGAPEPSETISMTTSMSPERLGTLTTTHSWCVWQSSAWNLSLSKLWLPWSWKGLLLPVSKDCCEVWDNYLWTCPLSPSLSTCLIKTLMYEMQVTCNFLFIDLASAYFNYNNTGNSLMVQQLGHGAFTAEGLCSTPGQGTKIPPITCHGQIIIKMLLMRK